MAAKILIAEDDAEIAELIRLVVERAGYTPVFVREGTDLFGCMSTERPAAMILDVMLPGIDGYELMMHISQDAVLCTIPVVVLTALSSAKSMFEKFPQVKAFMVKPFDPADLATRIQAILSSR